MVFSPAAGKLVWPVQPVHAQIYMCRVRRSHFQDTRDPKLALVLGVYDDAWLDVLMIDVDVIVDAKLLVRN